MKKIDRKKLIVVLWGLISFSWIVIYTIMLLSKPFLFTFADIITIGMYGISNMMLLAFAKE